MTDERTGPAWRPSRCARCGAAFECGAALPADGPGCWCVALPALPAPALGDDGTMLAGCLCAACLRREIARQQATAGAATGWPAGSPPGTPLTRDDAQ